MKKAYNTPEAELVEFGADVIVTSGCSGTKTEQNNVEVGVGGCTRTDSGDVDSNMETSDEW